MEKIFLIVFLLNVESSYSQNLERDVPKWADTVQWYISSDRVLRVRTFAIDEDVHVARIACAPCDPDEFAQLAQSNTAKHFGDILASKIVLESLSGFDELERAAVDALGGQLNRNKDGLIFWSPGGTDYRTKSTPQ
ncbi:MAG: hypothetical protein AAGK00_20350 [Pseudomonadota bacterium]